MKSLTKSLCKKVSGGTFPWKPLESSTEKAPLPQLKLHKKIESNIKL